MEKAYLIRRNLAKRVEVIIDKHSKSLIGIYSFKKLYFLILIYICIIPSLFLSYIKQVDPFFWWPLSNVANALNKGYFEVPLSEQLAYPLILYMISCITGLSALDLAYIPIGAFIVPILYYAFTKKLLRSNILAILLTIYISYDFSLYQGHYNTFAYAWTRTLFLTFLILFIGGVLQNTNKNFYYLTLTIPIFITIYFLHPTYTFWILFFMLYINTIFIIAKKLNLTEIHVYPLLYLTLSFFIIWFMFNQYLYKVFIRSLLLFEPSIISGEFLSTIKSFIGITRVYPSEKYVLVTAPPNRIIGYATFLRTLIILISLILAFVFWLKKNYKDLIGSIDSEIIIFAALILVGISHTIAYALYGHMSLRFVVLMYPVAIMLLFKKLNFKKLALTVLLLLVILAFIQTGSFIAEKYSKPNTIIYDTKHSSMWLINKTQKSISYLSDFHTSQLFNYYFKSKGITTIQRFYDSKLYEALIIPECNASISLGNIGYVIINKNVNSTPSLGWKVYEPLSKYFDRINSNIAIYKVYDDDSIWIFKVEV